MKPTLAILILLAAFSCKHDETASQKTKFTDGMEDSELLKVATDSINSGDYDKAAQCLRALTDINLPEAYEVRMNYYRALASKCEGDSDWVCVLEHTTYALQDTAAIALRSCGEKKQCKGAIGKILQNTIPEEMAKC